MKDPFLPCIYYSMVLLLGPRAGMIFYRKGKRIVDGKEVDYNIEEGINAAVFPGCQGIQYSIIVLVMNVQ